MVQITNFITSLVAVASVASAADIRHYPNSIACNGNRGVCSNIQSGRCCEPGRNYESASCAGGSSRDLHMAYEPQVVGGNFRQCGVQIGSSTCGRDNCFGVPGRLTYGSRYTRNYYSKRSEGEEAEDDEEECPADSEDPACDPVFFDLMQINGIWYQTNRTDMTQEQRNRLYDHLDAEIASRSVEDEFDQFIVDYHADDE